MSFIFCPLYKSMLNDDIKKRILNKIKELQCHSEWNTFDLHINVSDIEISFINIDDIIKQKNIWENISKLSIDLWRDFDYYKQYTLKSKCDDDDEYKKRLESLGCVCEEGVWRSVSRPSEEVVQTSVFMYCLYEMIVKEKIRDIGPVIADKSIICVFCDNNIGHGEDICENCDSSKKEIKEHQRNIGNGQTKHINNKKYIKSKNEFEIRLIKNKEDNLVDEYCKVKMKETCLVNLEDEFSQTLVNINNKDDKVFEDGINKDKWKCGKCEHLNEYTFINCKVCEGLYKDGKWNCGKCTMENSCVNDKCETCGEENFGMKEKKMCDKCAALTNKGGSSKKMNKDKELKIDNDKWKCERCEELQLYNFVVCGKCSGSRLENGLWQCSQCSLINNCEDVECTACDVMNDHLLIKNCKYCKKNELKEDEVRCGECNTWKCPFINCGHLNVEKDDYCQKCKIYYYSSQIRGMPVKIYNQERYMWICLRCHTYNELSCIVCECGKTRYKVGVIGKMHKHFSPK